MKKSAVVLLFLLLANCSTKNKDVDSDDLLAKQGIELGNTEASHYENTDLSDKVYFAFDGYSLSSDAKDELRSLAKKISSNKGIKILVTGHCDERGTKEYNLGLGQRRAYAVKNFLSKEGVKNIRAISYGEEKPAALGSNERSYRLNRRVEISVR